MLTAYATRTAEVTTRCSFVGQRTAKYSSATFLRNMGIPIFIDDKHAISHNKFMVIDGHIVITGSFNFTKAAEENNAENLLVIDDAGVIGTAPPSGILASGVVGETHSVVW